MNNLLSRDDEGDDDADDADPYMSGTSCSVSSLCVLADTFNCITTCVVCACRDLCDLSIDRVGCR